MNFYNAEQFSYPCEDPLAIRVIHECIETLQEEQLPFATLDFIPELFNNLMTIRIILRNLTTSYCWELEDLPLVRMLCKKHSVHRINAF